MKSLLLAAGFGTRLRPITDHVPKCLVKVQGRPLLEYWLDLLRPSEADEILVNTHYLPDAVRDFVAASPWHRSIRLVHEPVLLGTGGTILQNREFFSRGAFMVAHADNLTRFDLAAFRYAHASRPPGVEITMMTFETDTPESCGIVELDVRGLVERFHEKSPHAPGRLANAAVYIFEPTVIDFLESLNRDFIDVSTEVLPHYLGRMHTYHNSGYHRDIGTPESLAIAQEADLTLVHTSVGDD